MKISDAKKILSGELVRMKPIHFGTELYDTKTEMPVWVKLSKRDVQFALRQLALKVEREHKKMNKERE